MHPLRLTDSTLQNLATDVQRSASCGRATSIGPPTFIPEDAAALPVPTHHQTAHHPASAGLQLDQRHNEALLDRLAGLADGHSQPELPDRQHNGRAAADKLADRSVIGPF